MISKDKPASKKSKIIFLSVISAIYLAIFIITIISLATGTKINKKEDTFCYDNYNLLTENEIAEINNVGKQIQKKYGINIYVATTERVYIGPTSKTISVEKGTDKESVKDKYSLDGDNKSYYKADLWGQDFIKNKNLTLSENCVVLIINARKYKINTNCIDDTYSAYYDNYTFVYEKEDLDSATDYHFDIYTFGASEKRISDSELEGIIWGKNADNILQGSNYFVNATIGMMNELGESYSWIHDGTFLRSIIVGCILAIVASVIIVVMISKSYSKKRKIVNYSIYDNTKLDLVENKDIFLRKSVTYTVISSSSSSRGSSGQGSGSIGGGGGGGGSGHRGGR